MKTIVKKNGQKFYITDELYEAVQRIGLLEDEEVQDKTPNTEERYKEILKNADSFYIQGSSSGEYYLMKRDTSGKVEIVSRYDRDESEEAEKDADKYNSMISKSETERSIEWAADIDRTLKILYQTYLQLHYINPEDPMYIVFKSDKFQNDFYKKWLKISKQLYLSPSKRDPEIQKYIDSINPNKTISDNMEEDLLKMYNMI